MRPPLHGQRRPHSPPPRLKAIPLHHAQRQPNSKR
jgi:hypothetical protein